MKTFLNKILPILKNKFFIVTVIFLVIIIFFDKNNIIDQVKNRRKLYKLQQEKEFYNEEVKKNKEAIRELQTNPENLEKFGREKYMMKRDSEDIFLIIPTKKEED